MPKPALLSTGPMMPLISDQLEAAFEVHWMHKASDLGAAAAGRTPHRGHLHGRPYRREDRRGADGPPAGPQGHRQFRRRLRHHRRCGRRQRGIVITNTPDVLTEEVADTALGLLLDDGARAVQGRGLPARRALGQGGRLSPDARQPARPLDRHDGPRAHRQGHHAPARGLRTCRSATSRGSKQADVAYPLLFRPGGHGARRGYADRHPAGRPRHPEPRQRRGADRRSVRAASSSTWRAAASSTRRR